ncbi:MAG: M20 aminoacylase family protein [Pseudorhodobacter sp.]|nr:M20 aminoacylase family protein [Pseudorhodobacter sp.]
MSELNPRQFLADNAERYRAWRHHLHQYPEVAFEERNTAAFLKEKLTSLGLEIVDGLATTGLVATLRGLRPGPIIGMRADMDALPIEEADDPAYRSRHVGVMHACGHDGHMIMLLAAAEYLAGDRDFAGAARFIFQPAEEAEGGGRKMLEDGLFDIAPVDAVFGLHNWPGLPIGQVAVQPGPMMAAMDLFTIAVRGEGVHAALPHLGTDAIVAAGALVGALQTIASRAIDPHQPLVVSLTQIHGGNSLNALPGHVDLQGTLRSFSSSARDVARRRLHEIAAGIATTHNVVVDLTFTPGYPATLNHSGAAGFAAEVARRLPGNQPVLESFEPSMASEDFAFMLNARPGAYAWIGNGRDVALHSPNFDFNDDLIATGALFWIELAKAFFAGEFKPEPTKLMGDLS